MGCEMPSIPEVCGGNLNSFLQICVTYLAELILFLNDSAKFLLRLLISYMCSLVKAGVKGVGSK